MDQKEEYKRLKKDKGAEAKLTELELKIKKNEKAAHELEVKASNIDAAVFDLKAVNPTAVVNTDTRTPTEIIANIEAQGNIVSQALTQLSKLLAPVD